MKHPNKKVSILLREKARHAAWIRKPWTIEHGPWFGMHGVYVENEIAKILQDEICRELKENPIDPTVMNDFKTAFQLLIGAEHVKKEKQYNE